MTVAVLLPTVRPDLCKTFITSLSLFPQPVDELHIVAQKHAQADWEALAALARAALPAVKVVLTWRAEGGPVYPTRWLHAASHPEISEWVVADDDIELISATHWGPMIQAVQAGRFAVVSGGFSRTDSPKMLARFWPPREPRWIPQPVTFTSGGMVVTGAIVPTLVRPRENGLGLAEWLFDDFQVSLTAYLLGYQPARYRGSLAVHRILSRHGLSGPSGLYARMPLEPPDPQWTTIVRSASPKYKNGNDVFMPGPDNLTPEAHREHHANLQNRHRL